MEEFLDHPFTQFLILLLAIMGGIVGIKALAAYLPDAPGLEAVKRVILAV